MSQNDDRAWENAWRREGGGGLDRPERAGDADSPADEGEPQRDGDREPETDNPAAGSDDGYPEEAEHGVRDEQTQPARRDFGAAPGGRRAWR